MYIKKASLDDLLREVFRKLLSSGSPINPSRGPALELFGVTLELTNPRARLSRTEKKGKLFSSVGEFLWYLSKSNRLDFISYYIPDYKKFSDDGKTVHGGYGLRLFDWRGNNQIENIIELLRKRPDSRQAVIQLFDAADLEKKYKDIPCTCTLQFFIRNDSLHLVTSMRSNDAFLGLPHDIFSFTMLQEILAKTLKVKLGTYKHAVGSLHLYDENRAGAKEYVNEGFQPTVTMPELPDGDPWSSIKLLLRAESGIRRRKVTSIDESKLDDYWLDFVLILRIFACIKSGEADKITNLKRRLSSRIYNSYIDRRQAKLAIMEAVKKTSASKDSLG